MKLRLLCFFALSLPLGAAELTFNYAEALQKALYFYEAQQSGTLSPNNRVDWRGASCLTDGQDIGRDLSGGWFDAGDHWTANLTMSFAAMTLAWAAVEHPEGWAKNGQMDELLESLIHVNRYFLKCVLNPECKDPARELDVVIGCGGREGVDSPNVHAMWGPAEVAHLMTQRPAFRVNRQVPAGDIPAAMAAAMAASSIVIREHAGVMKGKQGYTQFNSDQFADLLLDRAEKLTLFARANAGPALTDKLPGPEQDRIRKARGAALRSDGKVVETGYRAGPFDKIVAAASWLQRAHLAKDPQAGTRWLDLALQVYEREYKAESNQDCWKDYSAGNFGKLAAFNLMRLLPADERFHLELQHYCASFTRYGATPGGLRLRERFAHEYGSLRHANNAGVIALYYSEHVRKAPGQKSYPLWREGKSNEELKEQFEREARRQVDYALGANPYRRSYVVGFGNQPFNDVHHRGAYGAWAGFEHFIPGKADDRGTCRHILYGALVAGPDHNDVFLCGKERRKWLPTGTNGHDFFYQFPNRTDPVRKTGYVWSAADQPVQDVMDSQFNEVALDYNAGFTANLAWLCAHGQSAGGPLPDSQFPPRPNRNDSLDTQKTDREFFVTGRRTASSGSGVTEIEAVLWNRSRWPSRVCTNLSFRYWFTLDRETRPEEVQVSVTGHEKARVGPVQFAGRQAYVEVSFPAETIYPGSVKLGSRGVTLRLTGLGWNETNDWSAEGLAAVSRLLPRLTVYSDTNIAGGVEP